jgi:hypothetical protein
MVKILQDRTQPITLYKVRAHVNIDGNEKADKLAKDGLELEHRIAIHPYKHAHATPYYYQKDVWASMEEVPDKGPVRFLEKQIKKYDRETNIAVRWEGGITPFANSVRDTKYHYWCTSKGLFSM